MKKVNSIVISNKEIENKSDLWLDPKEGLKSFSGDGWKLIPGTSLTVDLGEISNSAELDSIIEEGKYKGCIVAKPLSASELMNQLNRFTSSIGTDAGAEALPSHSVFTLEVLHTFGALIPNALCIQRVTLYISSGKVYNIYRRCVVRNNTWSNWYTVE